MKKLLLILLTIPLFACACQRNMKTGIVFNRNPITVHNVMDYSDSFQRGDRIYYLFFSKKEIKAPFLRIQVLKASDKPPANTFSIVYSNDVRVNKDAMFYFTDYIVFHTAGHYYMQVFDKNKPFEALARSDFYVK